jgi:hypothetical protein
VIFGVLRVFSGVAGKEAFLVVEGGFWERKRREGKLTDIGF